MTGFFQTWFSVMSDSPAMRILQLFFVIIGFLTIFFVFYALRDIVQRTRSFWYQAISILIVAALPIVGFFIYLLIRPLRTLREREMYAFLQTLAAGVEEYEEPLEEPEGQTSSPATFTKRSVAKQHESRSSEKDEE